MEPAAAVVLLFEARGVFVGFPDDQGVLRSGSDLADSAISMMARAVSP